MEQYMLPIGDNKLLKNSHYTVGATRGQSLWTAAS